MGVRALGGLALSTHRLQRMAARVFCFTFSVTHPLLVGLDPPYLPRAMARYWRLQLTQIVLERSFSG